VYNQGVKSFLKSKLSKKKWAKIEDEFKKRGDQVRSCTQYKKIDAVGYLLVPLNRKTERQKHVKKDALELLQLPTNNYLPVCRQHKVSL
jgi:hypothetical protein